MKKLLFALAMVAASVATAEELVIEAGQEETITANASYSGMTVNGTLTIKNGATVTIESAPGKADGGNVFVAKGDGETTGVTGKLIIKEGAYLKLPDGANASLFYLGYKGGSGELEVSDGGKLCAWDMYFASGSSDTLKSHAKATLTNCDVYAHNGFNFTHAGKDTVRDPDADPVTVVTLNEGALLRMWGSGKSGASNARIEFNGGQFRANNIGNGSTGDLVFEGVNRNPIYLILPGGRNASTGKLWYEQFINTGNTGCIIFKGDCDFVKAGGALPEDSFLFWSGQVDTIKFEYTGKTRIAQGGVYIQRDTFPKTELVLDLGTSFDANGNGCTFSKLSGIGQFGSRAAGASLNLGCDDSDSTLSTHVDSNVALIKTGTGTLTVSRPEVKSVDVPSLSRKTPG